MSRNYPLLVLEPPLRVTKPLLGVAVCSSAACAALAISSSSQRAGFTLGTLTVALVLDRLPKTGAVTMNWEEALSLVQLDQPNAERLRELPEELRKANVLFAIGSHVASFAATPAEEQRAQAMHIDLLAILGGLAVGTVFGMTGVGRCALLTRRMPALGPRRALRLLAVRGREVVM